VPTPSPTTTLNKLRLIVFIQWMGATIGLPLLPLFLRQHGANPAMVGIVMASFFVAGLLTQFILGHASDRFGRRPILIGGLAAYGFASLLYVAPLSAPWFAIARAIQGAGAGAIEVASLAAVAAIFSEVERGRAMSKIIAAQLLGFALGPLIGSAFDVSHIRFAFLIAGMASSIAAIFTLQSDLGDRFTHSDPLPPLQWTRQMVGAIISAVTTGLMIGVYETCWTMLMHAHHASTLQIRLSWTMFCLPWVLLSPVGGWLADHGPRRIIAIIGVVNGAGFLALYPHIHSNVALLFLGSCESVFTSLSVPSVSSLLTQGAGTREMGRRQGVSTTANTAALAASAGVAGSLFAFNEALPFTLVAVIALLCSISLFWFWGDAASGRVSPHLRITTKRTSGSR
jgi:DHA1 family multidrug resistance protein-like MFS transporter